MRRRWSPLVPMQENMKIETQSQAGLSHGSAAVPPNPSAGLCKKTTVSLTAGSTTLPCISQHRYVCMGEFSPLQITPPPHTHPSHWDGCPGAFQSLYSSLHVCPGQACKLRCYLEGRKQVFSSLHPSDFPYGAHGKGLVGKGGTCCGCLLLGHLYAKSLSELFQADTST